MFEPGCETAIPDPLPARIELTRDPDEGVRWVCRALGKLGTPTWRESGLPTFTIRDRDTGACYALSVEDVGTFLYYVPPERADAVQAFLDPKSPAPDCTFRVSHKTLGMPPADFGLRAGEVFRQPVYDVETLEGARAYFAAAGDENAAATLLTRFIEAKPAARPTDAAGELERALEVELAVIDRMEPSWLSPIGKQGYCQRLKSLASLGWKTAQKQAIAQHSARFCR
jgi:hypothetical protein